MRPFFHSRTLKPLMKLKIPRSLILSCCGSGAVVNQFTDMMDAAAIRNSDDASAKKLQQRRLAAVLFQLAAVKVWRQETIS